MPTARQYARWQAEVNPDDPTTAEVAAWVALRAGETSQAVDAFARWAQQNGEAPPGTGAFGYALALAQAGQLDEARRWYDRGVERFDELSPMDGPSYRFARREPSWLKEAARREAQAALGIE